MHESKKLICKKNVQSHQWNGKLGRTILLKTNQEYWHYWHFCIANNLENININSKTNLDLSEVQ